MLPSIQAVEGGRPGLVSHNADGSDDFGIMQVNSRWTPRLARLADDPCFSIAAAGAIMRTYLNQAHGNLLVAFGWYHSHTPARGVAYRGQVVRSAERMYGRGCRAGHCE